MLPELIPSARKIYTVREITQDLKAIIEDNFHSVWLKGEVSNFKAYGSGHYYFTVKELDAQINAVMFKGSNRHLKFRIEDGMSLILHGRISLYEPRGQYQIIVDHCEPDGVGALQLAFEQLKAKLKSEGLFDEERKRELPFLPRRIGVVTSMHGAVLHDIFTVLRRRFPNVDVLLYPVKVQGLGSAEEIAAAVNSISQSRCVDVLIVGRGGGSMEDLWAFNEESVVRAVADCQVPVISAVGHETDVTLCDFAADVRAPTPSAAAELAVPSKEDLLRALNKERLHLVSAQNTLISDKRHALAYELKSLPTPRVILDRLFLRLSDLEDRMMRAVNDDLNQKSQRLSRLRLKLPEPSQHLLKLRRDVLDLQKDLMYVLDRHLSKVSNLWQQNLIKLKLLSPSNVLERGYALCRKSDGALITRAAQLAPGDEIQIVFSDGTVNAVIHTK